MIIRMFIMGVFQFELVRRWALEQVMGLPQHMAAYISPALQLGLVLAICMTAAAFFKGVLLSSRKTGVIAVSSGARIVAVGVVGGIALTLPDANGAVVGMAALIAAFGVEALVLGARAIYVSRKQQPNVPV